MDYAALFAAGLPGGFGIGYFCSEWLNRKLIARLKERVEYEDGLSSHAWSRLSNLRRNCFLTNERGHRVRYADASVAVRERAEGGN